MSKAKDPGLKKTFKGHNDSVTAVDFHPESTQVVSGSLDASLLIWKLDGKQMPSKFIGHTASIHSVAFNPTGTLIATGSADNTVRLWENDSRGVSTVFKSHSGAVRACSFSFDGQHLLTGSDDKYLKIFTTYNKRHTATISAHNHWIQSAEFSPDSRLICSSSYDKTVKLWDSEQLTSIVSFEDSSAFLSARFHPDGTCVASGTAEGKVCVWDIRSQMLLQAYTESHNDGVNSVAFHNSGRYLVSASNDGTMKIFDLRKGALMYSLYGHEGPIQVVNFSKDGSMFASGGNDTNLILWESNLVDPEQEVEVNKLKKAKNDSKNLGKRNKTGAITASEKLKRLQKKRKLANKTQDENKENNPHALNTEESGYDTIAEDLASKMDKISVQLDIITRIVVTLEKRIGDNEEVVDQAYNAFKQHQANSEIRASIELAQQEKREQEDQDAENQEDSPAKSRADLEQTRDKVKNIMNIINISQYSLAAVQKSAMDIKNATSNVESDLKIGKKNPLLP